MTGRSLEELDELFEKRISVKDFPKYECEITRQAHEIAAQKAQEAGGVWQHLEDGEKQQ